MNITVNIPFLSWSGKPSLAIEIDASVEARFHLRAALLKAKESGANLYGADLRSANLRSANLYGANLRSADLRSADLRSANLRSANLRSANLYGADLRSANLYGADLRSANLRSADLRSADLRSANLYGADLRSANLYGADLYGADLRSANLRSANLYGADLYGAKNAELAVAMTFITPEGALVGWKKCRSGVIVQLIVPAAAKRSSACGRKCRAEFVEVFEVFGADVGVSQHDGVTKYRAGETVRCDAWCEDRWQECAGGIHFFLTRPEAENY